jgi:hypothetical protein
MADSDQTTTKLDRILNGLTSITVRLDAVEAKAKADADTGNNSDKILAACETLSKRVEQCVARLDEMEAADKSRKDDVTSPSLEPVTTADSTAFIGAQIKAERVAQAFGDSAGAPRWMNGEQLGDYRLRLLSPYKRHSQAWAAVPVEALDGVLDVAETQIYADALVAASSPSVIGAGQLREVIEVDRTGRRITKFAGDPEACWGPFKQAPLRVTGFDTPTKH